MIRTQSRSTSGLEDFCRLIGVQCPLAAAALRESAADELRTLRPGEILARKGEAASAAWIIERGEVDVGSPRIRVRHQGEIVGEAGLLYPDARRSADLVAACPTDVWCVSRDAISGRSAEQQAAVYRAIATSLLCKLDEAVDQRGDQLSDIDQREMLLRAFVPASGLALIRARLFADAAALHIHRETSAIILFSDIAGFSALTKSLSPEDAGAAAVRLQTPIIEAITAHNGELDKLMGDGAMAFWLAHGPNIPTESAAAAVDAAIEAVTSVRATAREFGWSDIDLRVGLHCGPVLIGDFGAAGRRAFTCIGPVVNAAARYEQARVTAGGVGLGPVRISPELWAHLPAAHQARFETEPHDFSDKHPPMLRAHRLRAEFDRRT